MSKKTYSVGLDIGTTSVGYAAIDSEYRLVHHKGKDVIGTRLFDAAKKADSARLPRSNRRRQARIKWRLRYVKHFFKQHWSLDPLILQNEKYSWISKHDVLRRQAGQYLEKNGDSAVRHTTALDQVVDPSDYPTIYHLRQTLFTGKHWQTGAPLNELNITPEMAYLAIRHIIKSRGHFNSAPHLAADSSGDQIQLFVEIIQSLVGIYGIEGELTLKIQQLAEKMYTILFDSDATDADRVLQVKNLAIQEFTELKKAFEQIAKAGLSRTYNLKTLLPAEFVLPDDLKAFDFNKQEDIDRYTTFIETTDVDTQALLENILSLNSALTLSRLFANDERSIAELMVKKYAWHAKQLVEFKMILQELAKNAATREFGRTLRYLYDQYIDYRETHVDYKKGKWINVGKAAGKAPWDWLDAIMITHTNDKGQPQPLNTTVGDMQQLAANNPVMAKALKNMQAMVDQPDGFGFLPKQRDGQTNRTLPNSLQVDELKQIIVQLNQLPAFANKINEIDEYSEHNDYKLVSLAKFRIPYFVGPLVVGDLNEKRVQPGKANHWMVRNENHSDTKITPYNMADVVDYSNTQIQFIERLKVADPRLWSAETLPSASLIYQEFAVYEELSDFRYTVGERPELLALTGLQKQFLVNGIYRTQAAAPTATKIMLALSGYHGKNSEENQVSPDAKAVRGGLGDKLNNGLSTWNEFRHIFEGDSWNSPENLDVLEEIVWALAMLQDEKSIEHFLQNIQADNEFLTDAAISKLKGKRYAGFSNQSREVIDGRGLANGLLSAESVAANDNRRSSILEILKTMPVHNFDNNNHVTKGINFTTIYFDELYAFAAQVAAKNEAMFEAKNWRQQVEGLRVSPAVKRSIIQAVRVLQDIEKFMGYKPEHVYVEVAKDDEQAQQKNKGKISVTRKDRLLELTKKISKEMQDTIGTTYPHDRLLQTTESDWKKREEKLYLYFGQAGRDIYDYQQELDLDAILAGQDSYEIDHVYAYSHSGIDSIDSNKVLTSGKNNQAKGEEPVSLKWQQANQKFWQSLRQQGLITETKYKFLMLQSWTQSDVKFIPRQLVETRQAIKNVMSLLESLDYSAHPVKAGWSQGLRNIVLEDNDRTLDSKPRSLNKVHHAHDAYFIAIVGRERQLLFNKLDSIGGRLPNYGDVQKYTKQLNHAATTRKHGFLVDFIHDRGLPIDAEAKTIMPYSEALAHMRADLRRGKYLISLMTQYESKNGAGFFNDTLLRKTAGGKPRNHKQSDPAIYGGVNTENGFGITIKPTTKVGEVQLQTVVGRELAELQQRAKIMPINQLIQKENGERWFLASNEYVSFAGQFVPEIETLNLFGKLLSDAEIDEAELMQLRDSVLNNRGLRGQYRWAKPAFEILKVADNTKLKETLTSITELLQFNGTIRPFGTSGLLSRRQKGGRKLSTDTKLVYQSPSGLFETIVPIATYLNLEDE